MICYTDSLIRSIGIPLCDEMTDNNCVALASSKGFTLYGLLIVAYLFLGGTSAGASFVMAVWSLVFHRKPHTLERRTEEALKALLGNCYKMCFVLLAISLLCLLWDLGSPSKALLLFTNPRPTILTFGAFSLVVLLAINALLTLVNVFDIPHLNGSAKRVLEIVCCVFALFVMTYTGLFLARGGIPFWNSNALIALFLFSSLSTGTSLVLLIDYFTQGKTILLQTVRPLQKAHIICLVLEALSLVLFLAEASLNPQAESSLASLASADMLATFAIGAIGMGIATPLAMESISLMLKNPRSIPVSDAICLIGGFFLRLCVVTCGMHWSGPLAW